MDFNKSVNLALNSKITFFLNFLPGNTFDNSVMGTESGNSHFTWKKLF